MNNALKGALRNYISTSRTKYRLDLRALEVFLHIPFENLQQMLSLLEIYAIDCYNKTTDHAFAIKINRYVLILQSVIQRN